MKKLYRSPISYNGNKFSLLSDLLPLFPKNIDTFVELFGGSGVVSYNTPANKYIYNDCLPFLKDIFTLWKNQDVAASLANLRTIVADNNLTKTDADAFAAFKAKCNALDQMPPEHQFILMCFSFNNQMRFNKAGEYNMPFGKRGAYIGDKDGIIEKKLINFSAFLQSSDITFHSADFAAIDIPDNSFVYLDPPYLLSSAVYQEKNEYTVADDLRLMSYCDDLAAKGIKFGMSNLLMSKGKENAALQQWATDNHYTMYYFDKSYANCNYQRKNIGQDLEVYICNY